MPSDHRLQCPPGPPAGAVGGRPTGCRLGSLATAVGYSVLVLAACMVHAGTAARIAPFLKRLLDQDKLAHFGAFAGFALLWVRADPSPWRQLRVFCVGSVFGVGIELLQRQVKLGSDADVYDALADFAGLAVGLMVQYLASRSGRVGQSGPREVIRAAEDAEP